MILSLQGDETKDLETKETCEKDRMEVTRKALLAGREIDDKSDAITKLESEIKDLEESIKKLKEKKEKVQEELDSATQIREDENSAWKVTDKEDQLGHETVKDAIDVLKKFYGSFVQTSHRQPVNTEGEAPLPPPATWEGTEGVTKKGESQGIISILEMIHEDIKKDQSKAKEEEDQAKAEYDAFKTDSEKEMKDLQTEADKQQGIKGEKETDRTTTIDERKTKHGEWEGLMKTMQETAPNCEYYAVNYKMRRTNRKIEIDGLNKAKAILQGGSFK